MLRYIWLMPISHTHYDKHNRPYIFLPATPNRVKGYYNFVPTVSEKHVADAHGPRKKVTWGNFSHY